MNIGDFHKDVVLDLQTQGGRLVTVANVVEAAECLTFDWPILSGERLSEAQDTCIAVLDGRAHENEARKAFILAAKEAKIALVLQ